MKKKDPAFLFYSTDFYEGTRMMLLEERATFIDLLIYQHQHQFIPNDFKRVALYCTGSNESIVKAVLEAKFKLCDNGWQNLKLTSVVDERKLFSNRQSVNGTVGQFFKKAIKILSKKDYTKLKEIFENQTVEEIYLNIKDKEINEAMLKAMLIAKLKHLEDEIKDEDRIKNTIEDRKKDFAEKLLPFIDEYGKPLLTDFYNYWTESNEGALKFRAEFEKVFDFNKRLVTWKNNNKKFNNGTKGTNGTSDAKERFDAVNKLIYADRDARFNNNSSS